MLNGGLQMCAFLERAVNFWGILASSYRGSGGAL